MTAAILIKVLHIFSAMWLAAGILGRELARSQARQANALPDFRTLAGLAGKFEGLMVQPGSFAIILSGVLLAILEGWPIFGFIQGSPINWLLVCNLLVLSLILIIPLIFIPRGKMFERVLQDAVQQGEITVLLRASFADPIVGLAHRYEETAILVIIFLMVAKPF